MSKFLFRFAAAPWYFGKRQIKVMRQRINIVAGKLPPFHEAG